MAGPRHGLSEPSAGGGNGPGRVRVATRLGERERSVPAARTRTNRRGPLLRSLLPAAAAADAGPSESAIAAATRTRTHADADSDKSAPTNRRGLAGKKSGSGYCRNAFSAATKSSPDSDCESSSLAAQSLGCVCQAPMGRQRILPYSPILSLLQDRNQAPSMKGARASHPGILYSLMARAGGSTQQQFKPCIVSEHLISHSRPLLVSESL
jgi:hypothetical protein